MNNGGPVKRPYSSPLRREQAGATRAAVIAAATRLFAERGYARTSIEDVAAAAGVARATVFTSVGGKAALLKTAYDVSIVGDDAPVAFADRPRSRQLITDADPRSLLRGYAGLLREMHERGAGLFDAVRGAAETDAEAASLWRDLQAQRRTGAANLVRAIAARPAFRPGLDLETAADLVWVLNGPGLYLQLVRDRCWPPAKYERWLGEALQSQLLAP